MQTKLLILVIVMTVALGACTPQPAATVQATSALEKTYPAPAATSTPAPVVFKTPIGDLAYVSARFVAEANGVKPAEGCNLLLVGLRRPDGSSIDVGQFQEARMQIFIRDADGSETLSTMGGLVDGNFVIGFQAPVTIKTYNLVWGDNPPLEIHPVE